MSSFLHSLISSHIHAHKIFHHESAEFVLNTRNYTNAVERRCSAILQISEVDKQDFRALGAQVDGMMGIRRD